MPSTRLVVSMVLGVVCACSLCGHAEAQIVRRLGGGIQINVPFVRLNLGAPRGAAAVATPGRPFLGRRRRLFGPEGALRQQRVAPRNLNTAASQAAQPDVADVDALPYPTAEELAALGDAELVETLRKMMARLHYRLSLLKTGEGWQSYLVLSREILGSPGTGVEIPRPERIARILPHYQSTLDNPQYAKIASFPSFTATYDALREVDRRFAIPSSEQVDGELPAPRREPPVSETPIEPTIDDQGPAILPSPTPAVELPNARRGERSILKRK